MTDQTKTIRTRQQYDEALLRFEEVCLAKAGTEASKEAAVLSLLIKEYEDSNFVVK